MMLRDTVSDTLARQQTLSDAKHAGQIPMAPLPATLKRTPVGADNWEFDACRDCVPHGQKLLESAHD